MNAVLRDTIARIPTGPGIYFFKDADAQILYIGKAANLRKRVSQYFVSKDLSAKIQVMKQHVCDIDYVETPTEADALLFEATLINRYKPKYNTRLKDDKSYPVIALTDETYPRLYITHANKGMAGIFFGPYTDATLLREALRLIHAMFPIRKCKALPKKACLYYRIHQCIGPCIHDDPRTREKYQALINDVASFLGAGKRSLISFMMKRMREEAAQLNFEEAGLIKKRIEALEKLHTKKFYTKKGVRVSVVATAELKKALGLRGKIDRIVCFDVSNIMGKWAVASKVSFFKEVPDKNDYRHYRIKTVSGIDDYAMMQEAVRRMLRGYFVEGKDKKPDLIMIDGGKGHLQAAREVLVVEGHAAVPCIAIAKRFEMLFQAGHAPIMLPISSSALNLVKKIRDEAHRFAVDYHTKLRLRDIRKSALDEITGVGAKRKDALLHAFTSVAAIRRASVLQIQHVPGISLALAKKIKRALAGS